MHCTENPVFITESHRDLLRYPVHHTKSPADQYNCEKFISLPESGVSDFSR